MRYQAAAAATQVVEALGADCGADAVRELLDSGVDVDKMWHAAQVVIASSIEAQETLFTGEEFGPDLGYGPARFASADDVARVAAGLSDITRGVLIERFEIGGVEFFV